MVEVKSALTVEVVGVFTEPVNEARRLERWGQNEAITAMSRCYSRFDIDAEVVEEKLTAWGGAALLVQAIPSFDVPGARGANLHLKQRQWGYAEGAYVESLVVPMRWAASAWISSVDARTLESVRCWATKCPVRRRREISASSS